MTKVVHLDENDRKLILETRQKLDKVTKLMEELLETIEILSDPEMMKNIREGLEDVKAGRVKELHSLLKEEARWRTLFSYHARLKNPIKNWRKTSKPE